MLMTAYCVLSRRYEALAKEMDFTLLYNPQRRLFAVGFNLEDGRLDRAHYDMLASEARIASLVAIAKSDTEHRHWFQLGRALHRNAQWRCGPLLWGGTMFEFLMPHSSPATCPVRSWTAAARQRWHGRSRTAGNEMYPGGFRNRPSRSGCQWRLPLSVVRRARARAESAVGKGPCRLTIFNRACIVDSAGAAIANFKALATRCKEGPWGLYERWTTRRSACLRASAASSYFATWRITRHDHGRALATFSATNRCSAVSSASRLCGPPTFAARTGSRFGAALQSAGRRWHARFRRFP